MHPTIGAIFGGGAVLPSGRDSLDVCILSVDERESHISTGRLSPTFEKYIMTDMRPFHTRLLFILQSPKSQ